MLRLPFVFLVAGLASFSADPPLVPLGVCEVLRDLPSYDGKSIAVIGRYSFRETGSWIGEQTCDPPLEGSVPAQLWLVRDSFRGPKPPGTFELDGIALNRKFAQIRRHTSLGKFRFGTPDYDRWSIIFGEVKRLQGEDARKAPANFVYRGDGVVINLTPDQ